MQIYNWEGGGGRGSSAIELIFIYLSSAFGIYPIKYEFCSFVIQPWLN